ncbi:MAG: acyltransferase, partial [Methylococcaceae bacterium]|nr:acyltransferase [Methylococcaceae bacterium]
MNKHLTRERLIDIDRAKGLAIFLVVVGHIVATDMPLDNDWYAILKKLIYKFHMPFFMYLSGIVFAYTYSNPKNVKKYLIYVFKKTNKLIVGYFLFGFIIFFGKIFFSRYMHVDNLHPELSEDAYKLLLIPSQSAAGSLWFIYVLMEMYVVFPILLMLRFKAIYLVLIGVALHFIHMPPIFMLDRLFEYFLFFSLGISVIRYHKNYINFIDKYFLPIFIIFLLSFFIIQYSSDSISKLIIGTISLPALHGLMRKRIFSILNIWDIYGKYTYSIYLMNTIAIGLIKGVILLFISWNGIYFLFIAPLLLFSGLYIPI